MSKKPHKSKDYWVEIPPVAPLLRPNEVLELTGLSRTTLYSLIAAGNFPPFMIIGQRASAMPKVWLDAYVQHQAALINNDK
ncbi:helix-turn-helix transcriptional regulator [Pseudahrensia aquimaris]|uniref:Helix-turn-helix transcriptional regulator n=1 Tax=Pseudahrensia aquimaris TaxID=744461 RepID=A0ABW3F914_9HYPH